MKKYLSLVIFISAISLTKASGQILAPVPLDYSFKTKDDYKPYEKEVIETLKLLNDPKTVTELANKSDAFAFVSKWLNGCPYVRLYLHEVVLKGLMTEKYKYAQQMFQAYHFGAAEELLSNTVANYNGAELDLQVAGIENMYNMYQIFRKDSKSKTMEEYGKLIESGKLMNWLEENIKTENTVGVKLK